MLQPLVWLWEKAPASQIPPEFGPQMILERDSGGAGGQLGPGITQPSMTSRVPHLGPLHWLLIWFPKTQKTPVLELLAPGQAQD